MKRSILYYIKQKSNALAAATLLVLVLGVYLLTLAPSVSFRDSGDMVSASYTLGVAHPSGFPLYLITGKLFSFIPLGELGARYSLLSALAGGFAALFVFLFVRRVSGSQVSGVFSALLLAFALSFWRYSSMSEKYALYAFFSALMIFLLSGKGRRNLFLLAFFFGLGLAHHLALLVFFIPVLLAAFILGRREGFSAKDYVLSVLLGLLPLLLYFYLPLRANAGGPLTWGGPMDLQRFFLHVTANDYRYAMFSGPLLELPARFFTQVVASFWLELTPAGFCLAIFGAGLLFMKDRFAGLLLLSAFAVNAALFLNYNIRDPQNIVTYYFASFVIFSAWAGITVSYVLKYIPQDRGWLRYAVLAALWAVISIWLVLFNFPKADLSSDRQNSDFGSNLLKSVDKGSLILVNGDVPQFSLWYQSYANKRDKTLDIVPSQNLELEKVIERNISNQKVYFSYFPYDSVAFTKYVLVPEGLAFRAYPAFGEVKVDLKQNRDLWEGFHLSGITCENPIRDKTIAGLYTQTCYETGEFFLAHGHYSEAADYYERCLKLTPGYGLAYLSLGELAEKAGKNELALKYYGMMLSAAGAKPAESLKGDRARIAEILAETVRVYAGNGNTGIAGYYYKKYERFTKWR